MHYIFTCSFRGIFFSALNLVLVQPKDGVNSLHVYVYVCACTHMWLSACLAKCYYVFIRVCDVNIEKMQAFCIHIFSLF